MQKVNNYKKWKLLSKESQEKEYNSWDVYNGDGETIILSAIKEMEILYKKGNPDIKINKGIYHGGILVIDVAVEKGNKIRLPKLFNGFPIMKNTIK
jgi:hypothetical protein